MRVVCERCKYVFEVDDPGKCFCIKCGKEMDAIQNATKQALNKIHQAQEQISSLKIGYCADNIRRTKNTFTRDLKIQHYSSPVIESPEYISNEVNVLVDVIDLSVALHMEKDRVKMMRVDLSTYRTPDSFRVIDLSIFKVKLSELYEDDPNTVLRQAILKGSWRLGGKEIPPDKALGLIEKFQSNSQNILNIMTDTEWKSG